MAIAVLGAACANGGTDSGGNSNGGSQGGGAVTGGSNNATSAGGSSNAGGATGNGGSAPGGGGATGQGGTTGQGGSVGAGGTTGSGGTISDAGPKGDGAPVCANADRSIISIDATGFVTSACNSAKMQGAWYCYSDGVGTSNCTTGKTPYVAAQSGMCLSGTTSTSATAYGAGVGFSLNDSGGTAAVKSAYNATTNQVIGFEVTITGTSDVALRLNLTTAAASPNPAPFVSLPGAGTYQVLLTDAVVPGGWANANAGQRLDPSAIYDVQLAVPADPNKAANYNYCITGLKPILAATPIVPTGACPPSMMYGSSVCGPQDLLGEVGNYAVQNNINGGSPGTQCVQAMFGATCGGFSATFTGFGANATAPSSYPSIVYGWQNGSFYGAYKTAKQLMAIRQAPTTWQVSTPSSGKWNAAYDIWLAPTAAPKSATGGLELMIWLNYGSPGQAPQPIGSMVGTKMVAGENWNIWRGSTGNAAGQWTYLAYQRPAGSNSANFNLMDFFTDAISEGAGLQNTWYLLGVQAGFEVWQQGSGTASTSSFSAQVDAN
jgi:hypothetical protein